MSRRSIKLQGDEMSETKHTPGPWTVDGKYIIGGSGIAPVAKVYLPNTNARLIAAAPELADALDELVDRLHQNESGEKDLPAEEYLDLLGSARAALEKAGLR